MRQHRSPRDTSTLPAFVAGMLTVIRLHDSKPDWIGLPLEDLFEGYDEERFELDDAIRHYQEEMAMDHQYRERERRTGRPVPDWLERRGELRDRLKRRIVEECFDLANRLYFLVDRLELSAYREVENGTSRRAHAGGSQDPDSAHITSDGAIGAGRPGATAEGAPGGA